MPVRPLQVLYDEKKQIKEAMVIVKAIHQLDNEEGNKNRYGDDFVTVCATLAFDLAAFKNPVFSEEKEIRLIHLLNFVPSNSFLKLEDAGGTYFGGPSPKHEVKFRIANNLPVPYIDIDFTNGNKVNPIQEVILGPKNNSRESAISVFLETSGLGGVKVLKSKASYR